jgi:hypothetical protein
MRRKIEQKKENRNSKLEKLEQQLAKTKVELKTLKIQLAAEVNERSKLEKQILKSEEKYSALFELSPSGIILEDTKGNILDANDAVCKSFGYSRKELLNMNVRALTTKNNYGIIQRNLKELLSGALLCHQVENIRKDGSICYSELYERKITLPGGEERILAITNDITSRRKVEDFLKESERRYKTLFDTANDAIFLMDGDKFIDCNLKTLEMFGCKSEDIINQSPIKFSPPKQKDGQSSQVKALEKIRETLKGKPQFFEWVHCRLDGSEFDTEVSLNMVELLTKNYVIAIVRDVTERNLNEKNLRESRENYKSLFNGVTAGIFRTTPEGIFINVNNSLVKMFKFPDKETLMNKSVIDFYIDKNARKEWMENLNKSNDTEEIETKMKCYDGSLIWVHASARVVRNNDGTILYYDGYLRDISESKLAELKLFESQQKYLALFNNLRDCIILENKFGEILDANKAASDLFGYSREIMLGMKSSDLSADSIPFFQYSTKRKRSIKKPSEIIAKLYDGRSIQIEVSTAAFNLGNQKLFISAARDISDRKRTEEKIESYTNELKELNSQKDRLFSILAHDLKSPMTALIGYTDLLESEFSQLKSEDIKDYILSIKQVAGNLNNLLENLLEWSTIQKDKVSFEPKNVILRNEVEKIIKLFEFSSGEKEIRLDNKINSEHKLFVDPNVLNTVLRNLVSNAIKFSNSGGRININSRIKNKLMEISVEDKGIGMTQSSVSNIFNNGVQSKRSGTNNESGSGLGLLICKELIEKNGGKIWANSKEDKGTKIVISIPTKG